MDNYEKIIKEFNQNMEKELYDDSPYQPFKVIPRPDKDEAELVGPTFNHVYVGAGAINIARTAAKSLNQAFSAGVKHQIMQNV